MTSVTFVIDAVERKKNRGRKEKKRKNSKNRRKQYLRSPESKKNSWSKKLRQCPSRIVDVEIEERKENRIETQNTKEQRTTKPELP